MPIWLVLGFTGSDGRVAALARAGRADRQRKQQTTGRGAGIDAQAGRAALSGCSAPDPGQERRPIQIVALYRLGRRPCADRR